jgi:hypothetical protein
MRQTSAPSGTSGTAASKSAFWAANPIAPAVASTRHSRGSARARAHGQHQHLVAVIEFRRVQDQHQRLSLDRQTGQNLAGERRHHIVRVNQPVHQHPRDPLRAPVDARGRPAAKSIRLALRTSSIVATSSDRLVR